MSEMARPGQNVREVFTASKHNRWQRAADVTSNGMVNQITTIGEAKTPPPTIRNTTGSDLDRFSVLALDVPTITPDENLEQFQSRVRFDGTVPTTGDEGRFGIILTDAPDGAIVDAVVSGEVQCMVNVTDTGHGYADITVDDETMLTSAVSGGAMILTPVTETGEQWVTVRLSNTEVETDTTFELYGCTFTKKLRLRLSESPWTGRGPYEVVLDYYANSQWGFTDGTWSAGTAYPDGGTASGGWFATFDDPLDWAYPANTTNYVRTIGLQVYPVNGNTGAAKRWKLALSEYDTFDNAGGNLFDGSAGQYATCPSYNDDLLADWVSDAGDLVIKTGTGFYEWYFWVYLTRSTKNGNLKYNNAAGWVDDNTTLEEGWTGVESDTGKFKNGPGDWNDLDYGDPVEVAAENITDASEDGASILTATDFDEMKSLLDLEIGTDVQAQSANLTTWSGIAPSSDVQAINAAANNAAVRGLLDLEAGTDFYSKASADSTFLQDITSENLTDLSDVDTDKSKTPADGDVLTFDGTDWNAETPAASGGTANGYMLYQDQKSDGTAGGSSVATTWTARELNTEVADTNGNGSLSSNQITLDAGTYLYRAWAPFLDVQDVRLRLYNATDATAITDGLGDNGGYSASTIDATSAQIVGRFTIAASKAIELQYYADLVQAINGLGFHDGLALGVEKYARIELIKIETSDAQEYILIQDQKSDGTAGGSSTATTWAARELNTEVYDTGSNCSLSSNQFTLDAGTYRYIASSPFLNVQDVRIRLYNVTDTAEVAGSLSDGGGYSASTSDALRVETTGRFTIASAKTFELQYYCDLAAATTGLGFHDGQTLGVEKYSRVELIKEG